MEDHICSRKVQTNIYSLVASCSTARMPCRFSAIRAARRSRTAYGRDIVRKGKEGGSKSDELCSWYDGPPFGLRAPSCVTSRPWPCECTPSTHACSWRRYPWIFDKGRGSFIPQDNWDNNFEKWWEIDTYRCLSILPASLYFRNSLLNTLCLLIHITFVGILASDVPFLLPGPVWRPFRFAARRSRVRAREWTVVGLIIMRPSLISFFTCVREFAFPISACSAGSSQILRWPTLATLAARRFCDRRFTKDMKYIICSNLCHPELTHSASGICKMNIQSSGQIQLIEVVKEWKWVGLNNEMC